jgi:hypothetical protein
MAPKRKLTDTEKNASYKKQRKEDSPQAEPTKDDLDKIQVAWALPTRDSKNNQSDQTDAITRYAPTLYGQPWTAIRTMQRPFRFPALRTPLFKAKGKDLDGTDPHRSSAALRDLFNAIKHATEALNEDGELVYTRDSFTQAFTNANDNSAVVASRSAAAPVFALDQDYRVEV